MKKKTGRKQPVLTFFCFALVFLNSGLKVT